MEVTSGGQSCLVAVDPGAQLVGTNCDCFRNRCVESRISISVRARHRRTRIDQVDRIEHAGAILALVAARPVIAAMRTGADDIAVGQEAAVGGANRPAWWCAIPESRSSTARGRNAASARGSAARTSGRNCPRTGRSGRPAPSAPHATWRRSRATACPASSAASSTGAPCSSVAQIASVSWPRARQKRAKMSAGSIEPTRLPRCLTPLI